MSDWRADANSLLEEYAGVKKPEKQPEELLICSCVYFKGQLLIANPNCVVHPWETKT